MAVVVPARNEAVILPDSLPTLLGQEYDGPFHVFLVEDRSEDGTAETARRVASKGGLAARLTVIPGEPLPDGWAGKVWALHQGTRAARGIDPELILLTDADIAYSPGVVQSLVAKARDEGLDLTSVMAELRASTPWERLLIPTFVFFFAKLYPFRWVNNPRRPTAAAAGGCILLRREALEVAGGFERIAGAIIDDCSLARLIKWVHDGGRLWLGLSHRVKSLRPYSGLGGVWGMVARTAYTHLSYSMVNLAATVLGMFLIYLAPPLALAAGLAALGTGQGAALSLWLASVELAAWVLMAAIYQPMLRWYGVSGLTAVFLPATALLYTLMTIDSAVSTWRGKGGGWKGRIY